MFIDDDLVDNVIPVSTRIVESFYSNLDQIDEYETMVNSKDNFFTEEISILCKSIQKERQECFSSFLENQPWLFVNPTMSHTARIELRQQSKKTCHIRKIDIFELESELEIDDDYQPSGYNVSDF